MPKFETKELEIFVNSLIEAFKSIKKEVNGEMRQSVLNDMANEYIKTLEQM